MRIVILCNFRIPEGCLTDGATQYRNLLAENLANIEDVDLHIITLGKKSSEDIYKKIKIHTIGQNRFSELSVLHPVLYWKIKTKMEEIDPDVIHVISAGITSALVVKSLENKYPCLATVYGILQEEVNYYRRDFSFYHWIRYKIISYFSILNEKYVILKIPNIVVDSESIKKLIEGWTKSKIFVVPAGLNIDFEGYDPEFNPENSPDVYFINNFTYMKGTDILIKAIKEVTDYYPEIKVYIAGKGLQENNLKKLVSELNLEKNISFLGFIPDEKEKILYKSCKMTVVPSRWDCQPSALFNGAAAGKPVIASDRANPGIIEDGVTGYIFKSEDYNDLAGKICILMDNPALRDSMGRIAQERVMKYKWNLVADKYYSIYKYIANEFKIEGILK